MSVLAIGLEPETTYYYRFFEYMPTTAEHLLEDPTCAGEIGVPPAVALIGFHAFLNVGGVQCCNLNIDSYGRVDLDPVEGTVGVELRDASGMPVLYANPFDPFDVSPCTWTLGPSTLSATR